MYDFPLLSFRQDVHFSLVSHRHGINNALLWCVIWKMTKRGEFHSSAVCSSSHGMTRQIETLRKSAHNLPQQDHLPRLSIGYRILDVTWMGCADQWTYANPKERRYASKTMQRNKQQKTNYQVFSCLGGFKNPYSRAPWEIMPSWFWAKWLGFPPQTRSWSCKQRAGDTAGWSPKIRTESPREGVQSFYKEGRKAFLNAAVVYLRDLCI